jgi:small-conductance mechanosensitive channel
VKGLVLVVLSTLATTPVQPALKRRTILAVLLLFAAVVGLGVFAYTLNHDPATPDVSQNAAEGMLIVLAGMVLYLVALLLLLLCYLVFGLLLALVLLSPLLLLGFWLLRRRKGKRVKRHAYQQIGQLYRYSPSPITPPQEKPIPLMQRQFKHQN